MTLSVCREGSGGSCCFALGRRRSAGRFANRRCSNGIGARNRLAMNIITACELVGVVLV